MPGYFLPIGQFVWSILSNASTSQHVETTEGEVCMPMMNRDKEKNFLCIYCEDNAATRTALFLRASFAAENTQ